MEDFLVGMNLFGWGLAAIFYRCAYYWQKRYEKEIGGGH